LPHGGRKTRKADGLALEKEFGDLEMQTIAHRPLVWHAEQLLAGVSVEMASNDMNHGLK
jgi:hypothetical protein